MIAPPSNRVNAAHQALRQLFADIRKLQRHAAQLQDVAVPISVRVHTLPPPGEKRKRGRPKGSRTMLRHVYVVANGHDHDRHPG